MKKALIISTTTLGLLLGLLLSFQVAQAALLPIEPISIPCFGICGNGSITSCSGETCDDGNTVNGDGCNSTCKVETNWQCTGAPSVCSGATGYYCTAYFGCSPVCGDSLKVGGETCDDGNATTGDGCSPVWFAGCATDTGWVCTGTGPGSCTPICGDGLKLGSEACDDHNISSGDGCSSSCKLEKGWSCPVVGQPCVEVCGNKIRTTGEACDDALALASGDGCSTGCTVETGWTCEGALGSASTCYTTCGDGAKGGAETCDDGNILPNDGCNAACLLEEGWYCSGSPSNCNTVCGDNLVRGAEECDDGAKINGDGCNSVCSIEEGWDCSGAECVVIDGPQAAPPESLVIPHFSGLIVEGYVTIYDLIVTTTAQFLGNLSIEGDTDIGGHLNVNGDVRLGNSPTDLIQLNGVVRNYIGGPVDVDDELEANSLHVNGSTILGDDSWGDVTIGGDLTATGGIVTLGRNNLGDDVIVEGDLQVNGNAETTGWLYAYGNLIAQADFVSRGLATFQNNIQITGGSISDSSDSAVNIADGLQVSGNVTATGFGSFYDVIELVSVSSGSKYGFAVCDSGDIVVGCAANFAIVSGTNDWLYGTSIYGSNNRGTIAPLQSCYASAYTTTAGSKTLTINARCFDPSGATTGYITKNLY